jgi:AraC family transcriptional regulator
VLRPYDLIENILLDIENGIREDVNTSTLADKYSISERHLRRLFKFAFNQSIAGYIRSRRLAATLDDLLETDFNILDIALEYGFDYEQTYINAFKREFRITPGNLRKSWWIVKIKPPLRLFMEENKK